MLIRSISFVYLDPFLLCLPGSVSFMSTWMAVFS